MKLDSDLSGWWVDLRHSRSALRQVEHLSRVEQPVELVQQLGALVATALGVDEDQQRLGLLRRYRLDDEDLPRGAGGGGSGGPGRRGHGRLDGQRRADAADDADAVAARRAAAAAGAVSLLHRRLAATANRRLERTLQRECPVAESYA